MRDVVVTIDIPDRIDRVWAEVERLETHVDWMADARRIEFIGDLRRGVGTRMRVETRLGPFRTGDVMEFVEWEPPTKMAVEHRGLFTGSGAFLLEPHGDATRFTWRESIVFPWFLAGRLGAWAARPVFLWVWRRNLRRLRDRF